MLNGNWADLEKIPITINSNGNLISKSEFDAIWLRIFISKVPAVVKIKIIPARKKRSPNLVIQKAMVEDLIASESLFQKPIKK